MDKYVKKTPRSHLNSNEKMSSGPCLRQTTIESLKGVVVVEHIWRLKSVLKLPDQTEHNILQALEELNKKIPSRQVLQSTKIGHTINRLTKHKDQRICKLASDIVLRWKRHFELKQNKPKIEVRCDQKTEKMRQAGRKHLAVALSVPEKHILPEALEREVFHQHKMLASMGYRRTMRTLVFTLKHHEDVRKQVANKQIELTDLVSRYKKESKIS